MPLFLISSATDTITNQAIPRLYIDQATYAPNPDQPHIGATGGLDVLRPLLHNARIEGEVIVCDVPCAFGRPAGSYWFRVTAPDAEPVGYAYASRESHRETACAADREAVWQINATFPSE
jgi:hypothetical protein